MINSHHISAPTVAGLTAACSAAAVLATTSTGTKAVTALGRLVDRQPSLAGYITECLEGIRTQGLNVVSYFIPSARALAKREITIEALRSVTGQAEIKATARISIGTLGWVAVTPIFQLAKTFVNACHRSIESGQQDQLVEMAHDVATERALKLAKMNLEKDAEQYKTLSERSIIPGWKSLLLSTAPVVLLIPELGVTALAAGAVAGAAQIAGNAWEKWANSSMYSKTNGHLKSIEFSQRAIQLKSNTDEMGKRMDEHLRVLRAAENSHQPISQ